MTDVLYQRELEDNLTIKVGYDDGTIVTVVSTDDGEVRIDEDDVLPLRYAIDKACETVVEEQQSRLCDFEEGQQARDSDA